MFYYSSYFENIECFLVCLCVHAPAADEQSYILRDAEAEVLFGFSLEESLKKANSAPLFKVKPMIFLKCIYMYDWFKRWKNSFGTYFFTGCPCICLSVILVMKGKYFYLTPGICPSLSTMKCILESAGGKLLTKQPTYRKIIEHKQNKVLENLQFLKLKK